MHTLTLENIPSNEKINSVKRICNYFRHNCQLLKTAALCDFTQVDSCSKRVAFRIRRSERKITFKSPL